MEVLPSLISLGETEPLEIQCAKILQCDLGPDSLKWFVVDLNSIPRMLPHRKQALFMEVCDSEWMQIPSFLVLMPKHKNLPTSSGLLASATSSLLIINLYCNQA